MIDAIATAILRHLRARSGGQSSAWEAAMQAESEHLKTPAERLRWAAGCLVASYRMKPPYKGLGFAAAMLLAMGLVGLFNWRSDESGIVMGLLVLGSGAVGALRPKATWLTGLLVGLVVPAQSLFTWATGLHPIWERGIELARRGPDFSLFVLVVPAMVAALAGGLVKPPAIPPPAAIGRAGSRPPSARQP